VYVAMKKHTHKERSKVARQMSRLPGAMYVQNRVDYSTYLKQVANSKFVAAPRGSGIDTHRAWEVSSGWTGHACTISDLLLHRGVRCDTARRLPKPCGITCQLPRHCTMAIVWDMCHT
jgi:hypothetical protein